MTFRNTRRVLIYKRTHIDDPNPQGEFGCSDCMGQIRGWQYDGVIGIGGSSYEPRSYGIDGRITWVGVDPHRWPPIHPRGAPVVTFDRFSLFNARGKLLLDFAPALAAHFFAAHRRFFFSTGLREDIQREIDRVLELAEPQRNSPRPTQTKLTRDCRPRCCPRRSRKCIPDR